MIASFIFRFRMSMVVALGALVCSAPLAADEEMLARSVAGYTGYKGEQVESEKRDPATLKDLSASGDQMSTKRASLNTVQQHASLCCSFWVYEARTRLFDDFDGDGHFTYLRVSFDIDTILFEADVYVRLFLRGSDGFWNLIFHSEEFSIYGTSSGDEYEVETELVAGFPPDDYDVMIEVYEGVYGDLVAEYGPANSSALSFLPLEDISFDRRVTPPVVISSGGGGAVSLDMLILLLFAGLAMQRGDGSKKTSRAGPRNRIGPLCWSDDPALATHMARESHRRYVVAGVLVSPQPGGASTRRAN